ncbi:MAG: D-tyrosyl-tRNA(Tyr) deacylase [Candidatus Hydrothermae bacterium]|nr:D-tyrosyl-tRNA(Tyr) deacylase [Candidatus Hydrothermae bacterium]
MKAVIQRVKSARVRVGGKTVGEIGRGILILAAVERGDDEKVVRKIANKCVNLRIFEDEGGKFNLSALDLGLEVLAISNFTVAGNTEKGRRPSLGRAEDPERAKPLFDVFLEELRKSGLKVETGVFGAKMEVELVNQGPVTFIVGEKKAES